MSRELRLLISDILQYANFIGEWCSSLTYAEFAEHPVQYHAVIRALTVIGEAAKNVDAEFRALTPEIPWREIAGMRDVVVHHYFGVQDTYIWDAAANEMPAIAAILADALTRLERDDDGDAV